MMFIDGVSPSDVVPHPMMAASWSANWSLEFAKQTGEMVDV
jgi:hypothetical protein